MVVIGYVKGEKSMMGMLGGIDIFFFSFFLGGKCPGEKGVKECF